MLIDAGADINYDNGYLTALDHVLPSDNDRYAAKPGKLALLSWLKVARIPGKRKKIAKLLIEHGGRVSTYEGTAQLFDEINSPPSQSRGQLDSFIHRIIFDVIPERKAERLAARKANRP